MTQEVITKKSITINLSILWIWVTGLVTGTAFVVAAYYGLQAEIADLKRQLELATYRIGVLEKQYDK